MVCIFAIESDSSQANLIQFVLQRESKCLKNYIVNGY